MCVFIYAIPNHFLVNLGKHQIYIKKKKNGFDTFPKTMISFKQSHLVT